MGPDGPIELGVVLALFVTYLIVDRVTQSLALITQADLDRPAMVAAAIANRWWLYLAVAILAVIVTLGRRERIAAPWDSIDHGATLRVLALPLVVYLVWEGALHPYNFVADEAHVLDRVLVAVLGGAALFRPVLLIPFIVQFRIINEQSLFPFGTAAAKNVDEFLVLALVGLAACYLLFIVFGRTSSSAVVLLLGALVAAHFFVPGRGKLGLGWLTGNDIANLPLGSHTAGWLGGSDGSWARTVADGFESFSIPVMAATLVLELGSVFAVFHPRLLRWWLPGSLLFHLVTFATTGFFFLGWAALEIGLLVLLVRPRFSQWVMENATPARGIIASLAVLAGPVLFHPPGLAWIDGPISYGYEVEATGESGRSYHVPLSAFAPLDHEMTFSRLQFGATVPLSGAYGALATTSELAPLEALSSFDDVAALEASQPPTTLVEESEQFILDFFDRANADLRAEWLYGLGPPPHFWSSREASTFDFDEPLVELEVYHVTSLHQESAPPRRRELVLQIERAADGGGVVVEPAEST